MAERQIIARKSHRRPIVIPAICRVRSGRLENATLSDISDQGCCISIGRNALVLGQPISVRPNGLEALNGHVRWIRGEKAGIEFDRALYTPVVDHLERAYAEGGYNSLVLA